MPSIEKHLVRIAIPVVLVASAVFFGWFYEEFYPIEHWLFWRYAIYWLSSLVFSAACVSAGYAVVHRLRAVPSPLLETVSVSFASGVVLFYVAMNVLGHLHALRWPAFFLLPLVMIGAGARPLSRLLRRGTRHLRARRARGVPPPSPWTILAWLFGIVVLGMIYFQILHPENAQFDARWKHLALAEQYAHIHHIPRYGEGWTVHTNPHLASMIFTWGFLMPGARLFDQVALSAHLEFVCLIWTVAAIPALVRRLVPGARASASWAARFLFPGVLLYDSSLAAGADHIAAVFAIPIVLCLLRALRDPSPQRCSLLGLQLAGAALPKLTAGMMLIPGPTLALGALMIVRLVRERKLPWKGPVIGAAVALGATAFFWLRNWVWYGDPVYPSLHKYLTLRPWHPDAADMFVWGYQDYQFWRPERSLEGLIETVKALFTHSFIPNDYPRYHGMMPVFGSLFTLLLLVLPFFKKTRRIWGVVGIVHLGIFVWYWVHHQDRYLQTLLPLMAAVVAAIVVLVWRTNRINRIALGFLIATQVVIGGDVYFIEAHAMIRSPLKVSADLLNAGYRKRYDARFDVFKGWTRVGEATPEDAHLMLHDNHVHLGVSRRTTSDWGGWQYGINYGRLVTPRAVWEAYRDLGVTHVVWVDKVSKGWDSLGGDLVFFDFATRHTVDKKRVGSTWIGRIPDEPPPDEAGMVAVYGCGDMYEDGLYDLGALTTPVFGPRRKTFPKPLEPASEDGGTEPMKKAAFVVIDPVCASNRAAAARRAGFEHVANRKLVNSWRRKRPKKAWQLYVR